MPPYIPPQKRNKPKEVLKKITINEITKITCMQCGKSCENLNEFKKCTNCSFYCLKCHKKPAEFGILKAVNCIDCKDLSDNCFCPKRRN